MPNELFPLLSRREVLLFGAATAIAAGTAAPFAWAGEPGENLSALFDSFVSLDLDASPEGAASLGLDTGQRAGQRRALDDRSLAFRAKGRARIAGKLKQLLAVDRRSLRGMHRISYDVVRFCVQSADGANSRYDYGPIGAGAPYVISPLTGAYLSIPDFLDGQHPVQSTADADAYLTRLEGFAAALDQEIEAVRHDVNVGCTPPTFALGKTLRQLSALRGVAASNSILVTSLVERAKERGVSGHYDSDAARIVNDKVYPALDRQIDLVTQMQSRATSDAVGAMPLNVPGSGLGMIVEMRTYKLKPGMRERFLAIFVSKSMPEHHRLGEDRWSIPLPRRPGRVLFQAELSGPPLPRSFEGVLL